MKKLLFLSALTVILFSCGTTKTAVVKPKGETKTVTERFDKQGKLKRRTTSTTTHF